MFQTSVLEPPGFSDMSKLEQIKYVQALWDQISERPDDIPVLESHLKLAEERLRDYHKDPSEARPAFEILDRLSRKPT